MSASLPLHGGGVSRRLAWDRGERTLAATDFDR
jgi:hypothetical protein